MTVEVRPLGVSCNLQCLYCYQHPQRDAGNIRRGYDIEKMKAGIEKEGGAFSLFGGEALLIPEDDLEELWSWGYEKFKSNGIQTNGTLINNNHMRMFKQYNVHVGVSVDGPGELNDARWAGSLERTREMTDRTHAAIERLAGGNIRWSLIVTLHRNNATPDKLPLMHDWFRYMDGLGACGARLHIMEVENDAIYRKYGLSPEENIAALLSFAGLEEKLVNFKFDIFKDMRHMLLGQDNAATCIWNACDPHTTRAVRGVEGGGQRSNCGRTNKDGIDFIKADVEGFERYLALYHTPQEYGGCRDCRFFLMCKGSCPGSALDYDWRNRSAYCRVWFELYRYFEDRLVEQGLQPLSLRPERRQAEHLILEAWAANCYMSVKAALTRIEQGRAAGGPTAHGNGHGDAPHGDHTDGRGPGHRDSHGDAPHGDAPHGDAPYGDHTDGRAGGGREM
ncbi:MAG: radical SAM protein [Anaerolineae bacterium]|nr:radical SAM protein [Anaerolineae bacterium]